MYGIAKHVALLLANHAAQQLWTTVEHSNESTNRGGAGESPDKESKRKGGLVDFLVGRNSQQPTVSNNIMMSSCQDEK